MKYLVYILSFLLLQKENPLVMLFPKSSYEKYELCKNYRNKNYKGFFLNGKFGLIRDTKPLVSEGYDSCGETFPDIKKIESNISYSCLLILDMPKLNNHVLKLFSINKGKAINPGFTQKIILDDTEYPFSAIGLKGEFKDNLF